MIAKILIKRCFKPGKTKQILALLNDLRAHAMRQPGYISGETLVQNASPHCMVIIGTWQSIEDWYCWRDSNERNKYEAMIELYQERPTEYEELLLGTPLTSKDIGEKS
ncbi:MAG: antibiotic biosynthesis monooxygenase [Desulfatitalea sp.]|nr:antibiotic biosynthesis monooxygenase [Desulfatitalea sp.]NNK00102.1 antibiotic biosynthesis monooxygenase [Desulfatitalea sp.]